MNRLLPTSSRRFFLRHPWQLALAIAGIALGVAVYVGVRLASDSAARAFDLSSSVVGDRVTHRLLAVGGELPQDVYRELVVERGVTAAAPIIEVELRLGAPGAGSGGATGNRGAWGDPRAAVMGRRYVLRGIDPLEELDLRGGAALAAAFGASRVDLITQPGTVLVPESLAATVGESGTTLEATVDGRRVTLEIVGTLGAAAGGDGRDEALVADIATVQELSGRLATIDYVDLALTAEAARELERNPPPGTVLVPASESARGLTELATAFRTNLTALGLLALAVGTFLIYGTMSFAIVQRRAVFGVWRALGLARRDLVASVLLEAAALGAVATAIGLVLGHALATQLVNLVLRTIGDLYYASAVAAPQPSRWIDVQGAALGVAATLVAALAPALDAARTAPAVAMRRAALERAARRGVRYAAAGAVALGGLGGLLVAVDTRSLYVAFAGLFCILGAGALLTPAATVALMRLAERPADALLGLPGLLAARGVTASLSRTGVATAALAVAVAAVIGVGIMIGSFRTSLERWLDSTLTADIYISLGERGGAGNGTAAGAQSALVERIAALEAVDSVALSRSRALPTPRGDVTVRGVSPDAGGFGLSLTAGVAADALAALAAGEGVAVSERLAYRDGLSPGEGLVLPTVDGNREFPIVAVFRDFNIGTPGVVMALERYRAAFADDGLDGIGVRAAPGAAVRDLEERVRRELADEPFAGVRSSERLRELSLSVFDRTFKITEVLRVLAGFVAFLGVLSALLAIELERGRERAVLRALGLAPRALRALLVSETGLLGAAAGIAAMPLGIVLAAVLVHVINRRSFGWSMDLLVTPEPLVTGFALAVVAALVAGIVPAWQASRTTVSRGLREE